jgi:putative ABC transport system permease protein
MFKDYFNFAIKGMRNRKLRTVLTALGIIISVTAILTLILLGEGLKDSIYDEFESMGLNMIMVFPKGMMTGSVATTEILSTDDVRYLEELYFFDYITPMAMRFAERIEFRNTVEYAMLVGIPYDDFENRFGDWDWELQAGKIPNEKETRNVLIGYSIWQDIFDEKISANANIKIKDQTFRVGGILARIGNQQDDNSIIMDISEFRELYDNPRQVDTITLGVNPIYDVDMVAERTKQHLERRRRDENFEVYTAKQIMDQIGAMLGGLTFLLTSIAFIAIIVGGIGIMNSMFTNVLERTSEIGIMKSIGAQNKDILNIFLIEAGLIGLFGGIIGVISGQLLATYIAEIINNTGYLPLHVGFNYPILIGMFLFSITIGLISGYLPAKRASSLKPVDAIRYD